MTNTPNPDGFEDTEVLPAGRKSREISDELWAALADSAKRGVGKFKAAAPGIIDDLRKDLGAAAVRVKYEITQGTEKISDELHKLSFSATRKPEAEAPANSEAPK